MKFTTKSIAVVAISLGAVAGMTACSSSSTSTPETCQRRPGTNVLARRQQRQHRRTAPSYWPADVTQGLNYVGGAQLQTSISGEFQRYDSHHRGRHPTNDGLQNQGWTSSASFGGGANGGVASWKKGSQTAQVVVANEKGNDGQHHSRHRRFSIVVIRRSG